MILKYTLLTTIINKLINNVTYISCSTVVFAIVITETMRTPI